MIDIEGIKARLDIAENGIKCAEQAIENAKACFDKAKEMLDAKDAAPPRNWPERIEAGDCFEQENGSRYLVCGTKFVNLDTGALWLLGGGPSGNDKTDLSYLGKIDLTIRTDAHEPTGAELVGRAVEVTNDPSDTTWGRTYNGKPIVVTDYRPDHTCPYKAGEAGNWRFARLAK